MTAAIDLTAWHAARAKVVGASEVSALFGCQPDYAMSLYTLWHVKAGLAPPPEVKGERPKWGLRIEEAVGEAVREDRGWLVERPVFRHAAHPTIAGMGCTLDFNVRRKIGDPPGCLEVKQADWLIHRRQWGDEPPLHIQLQLQHQLACTMTSWGAVACLVGGNSLEVYEYERNHKVTGEIEKRVASFWRSIREGKAPPVDGSGSTSDTLRALYPHDDGVEVPADLTAENDLPELCASMLTAGAARREAEKAEGRAKNGILAKLGEHRAAWCQGYLIKAASVADNPGTLITPDMVGTFTGARRGHRRVTIKETEA